MIMFSVDPGATGTGLAVWEGEKLLKAKTIYSPYKQWTEKCTDIVAQLGIELAAYNPYTSYFEMPAYMAGVGGQMVARSGDLVKLCLFTGMLFQRARQHSKSELVPVSMWKGQLPKKVCEQRIRTIIDLPKTISNHAVDAVGIGLWAQGRFK